MSEFACPRCGGEIENGYVLDAVVHPDEPVVCEGCHKIGDEVVDP